jgi:addiction module HigA family antidote
MRQEVSVNRERVAAREPIHPGIIVAEEVMPELRKTRTIAEIASLLGVSRQSLHRVMAGEVAISPDMAVRLGKLCGNGAGLWIRLQGRHDTWHAARRLSRELNRIPTIV